MDALSVETLIDGYLKVVVILGVFFVPLLGLTAIYEWAVNRHPGWFAAPKTPVTRPDTRLSARERALLGDDWRDAVAPYFATRNQTIRSHNDPE